MGGQSVWGCLKYIPHRLARATLIAPVINYWWPGFPKDVCAEAYYQQLAQDHWVLAVAHYAPWLVYWWTTQEYFSCNSVVAGKAKLTPHDSDIISKLHTQEHPRDYSTKQGVYESYHRDMVIGFGKWEFDPMDIKALFVDVGEGSVHLWYGDKDELVPVMLQRYTAKRLPWIHYHEVSNGGHLFPYADDMKDAILKSLLTGKN